MMFPPVRSSLSRRAGAVAAVVGLALALGACSSSGKPGAASGPCSSVGNAGEPGTTTAADAKETAKVLNRGLQEQVAGDLTKAEKDFKEVITRDPVNKYAFYNLGLICQNAGKNADAENQYRQAIAIDPNFDPALYNLGILRALANDVPDAISLYRRAIAANANDARAHYNLGLLLRGQNKTEEGNKEVQTAVNLDSSLKAKAVAEGVPLTGP